MDASTAGRVTHGVWLGTLSIWLVASDRDGLRFVIHDAGPGFDVTAMDPGEGMQIMNDRISALAGELSIESARGRGTTVTGRVPTRIMETWSA
jgi:signal transduction histidine kinase